MKPVVLYISPEYGAEPWQRAFRALGVDWDFRVWPDGVGDPAAIDVALVWKPPAGVLAGLPNLKAILNLGAGVDALLADPTLPAGVPVARLVDDALTQGMTEYVLYAVLHFHRGFDRLARAQAEGRWAPFAPPDASACRVGLLGLGALGMDAARKLADLDFAVAGWSRTPKTVPGVESFAGNDGLKPFLARTDILICLLPLTPETEGILNAETFAALPQGAAVINAARGGHLVEDDLIAALDTGHLSGAMLDVFRTEPLPDAHPFWRHPAIVVTPHVASVTAVASTARLLVDNVARAMAGEPLRYLVDRDAGY